MKQVSNYVVLWLDVPVKKDQLLSLKSVFC